MMSTDKKKKETIYLFGNPLLPYDSLPLRLVPGLEKIFPEINFVVQDPNENLKPENGELIIIDTIMGLEKITIINDLEKIDKIETSPRYSLHDLDLGFNLKLLKKIGELKKVTIIGVPPDISEDAAIEELAKIIGKTTPYPDLSPAPCVAGERK